jgi:hypothetical protein
MLRERDRRVRVFKFQSALQPGVEQHLLLTCKSINDESFFYSRNK